VTQTWFHCSVDGWRNKICGGVFGGADELRLTSAIYTVQSTGLAGFDRIRQYLLCISGLKSEIGGIG